MRHAATSTHLAVEPHARAEARQRALQTARRRAAAAVAARGEQGPAQPEDLAVDLTCDTSRGASCDTSHSTPRDTSRGAARRGVGRSALRMPSPTPVAGGGTTRLQPTDAQRPFRPALVLLYTPDGARSFSRPPTSYEAALTENES